MPAGVPACREMVNDECLSAQKSNDSTRKTMASTAVNSNSVICGRNLFCFVD